MFVQLLFRHNIRCFGFKKFKQQMFSESTVSFNQNKQIRLSVDITNGKISCFMLLCSYKLSSLRLRQRF